MSIINIIFNRRYFICMLITTLITVLANAEVQSYETAPDFLLSYIDHGGYFNLYENTARRILLYFWSPISPEIKNQMLMLHRYRKALKQSNTMVVDILFEPQLNDSLVSIEFIKNEGIDFMNLIDNKNIAYKYGVNIAPAYFVINKKFKILQSGSDIDTAIIKTIIRTPSIKCAVTATALNLVPGVGNVVFKGLTAESKLVRYSSYLTTIGFYGCASGYLIDKFTKPDFKTSAAREKYENIMKYELYALATSYIFNLMSGYLTGLYYANHN